MRQEARSEGSPRSRPDRQEHRSRTFTGCRTCRNRHLKCDEARPACSSCRRLGIECEGYAPRLLWMTQHQQPSSSDPDLVGKGSSCRFPLFAESVRETLSMELTQSLGERSAGNALVHLDDFPITEGDDELRLVGPFGVFRAYEDPATAHLQVVPDTGDDTTVQVPFPSSPGPDCIDDAFVDEEFMTYDKDMHDSWQRTTHADEHVHVDRNLPHELRNSISSATFATDIQLESWEDIPRSETCQPRQNTGLPTQLRDDLTWGSFSLDLGSEIDDWVHDASFQDQSLSLRDAAQPTSVLSGIDSPFLSVLADAHQTREIGSIVGDDTNSSHYTRETVPRHVSVPGRALPMHADKLLRYLKQEVLSQASEAFPGRISPWKELLLPCGLETFAEISLFKESSHTRLSILCTLLAKSAYHLHKSTAAENPQSASDWLRIAIKHQHDGQEHLKWALMTEQEPNARTKYSETLMAMLGAGFVMMYFNRPSAVKKVLIDAEHLIRLRGIPSKKSYRLRVLHHMYTHLRVIMESTDVSSSFGTLPAEAPETYSSDSNMAIVPVSKFRIAEASLGELDSDRDKPDDIGYNDIHLEVSGNWQLTMYPEMYGIPETLMTLHAQTIGLVNEKSKLELAALSDPSVALALKRHIKTLEQKIWTWKQAVLMGPERPPSDLLGADDPPAPDFNPLALAIQQALIIYFYRRVYNMSALIMQEEVRKTLEYIQPYLDIRKYDQDFAITIGWALFLAACEAATPELQKRSMKCLEVIDHCGIFVETSKPSTIAKAVWQRREQLGDLSFSWPDLMV